MGFIDLQAEGDAMNPVIYLRLRSNISITQVAQLLHVSRQTAYNWETNRSVPCWEHRLLLMAQTGWSADKMLVWIWQVALGQMGIEYAPLIFQPAG
jgi:DNA-binding XRE family transcriptional regulator